MDASGSIGFSEFLVLMSMVNQSSKQYEELVGAFEVFDVLETEADRKRRGMNTCFIKNEKNNHWAWCERERNPTRNSQAKFLSESDRKRGFLSREKLKATLTSVGEPFNEAEFNGKSVLNIFSLFRKKKEFCTILVVYSVVGIIVCAHRTDV